MHQVWRRVGEEQTLDTLVGQDSGPSAQEGEQCFLDPATRSTNSSEKDHFTPPATRPANKTEQSPHEKEEQEGGNKDKSRKFVAAIPDAQLNRLRANCEVKASTSLLGRIQGKHPGLKTLTSWARETLHKSLTLLSLKSNNFFEVTFSSTEGRLHALKQTDLVCDSAAIFFSSWRPHVNSRTIDTLDYPVWVHIVNLCQMLREESFLRMIGEQLGQVIDIDNSDIYKAKLFGPRMRILVQDINNLPQLIVLPRLDGEGVVEYELEYSGLPHQCGRCRSRDHLVRNCPRKETTRDSRETRGDQRTKKRGRAARHATETATPKSAESPTVSNTTTSPCTLADRLKNRRSVEITPAVLNSLPPSKNDTDSTAPQTPGDSSSALAHEGEADKAAEGRILGKTQQERAESFSGPSATPEPQPTYIEQSKNHTMDSPKKDEQRTTEERRATQHTQLSTQDNGPELRCLQDPHIAEREDTAQPAPEDGIAASLVPDEKFFPRLPSPARPPSSSPDAPPSPTPTAISPQAAKKHTPPAFIWRPQLNADEQQFFQTPQDKGKGKGKPNIPRAPDSAPITRQGYRSSRLADDFWVALGIPNTPASTRKTLQVIPFLTKEQQTEQA